MSEMYSSIAEAMGSGLTGKPKQENTVNSLKKYNIEMQSSKGSVFDVSIDDINLTIDVAVVGKSKEDVSVKTNKVGDINYLDIQVGITLDVVEDSFEYILQPKIKKGEQRITFLLKDEFYNFEKPTISMDLGLLKVVIPRVKTDSNKEKVLF